MSPLVLAATTAVRQVAGDDHELRLDAQGEPCERILYLGVLTCTHVKIGNMQDACGHERIEAIDSAMGDDSPEIFDDLYLGLRAGGALRKQRRGEPLTTEEEEALGRWQRLSTWRKAIAIGGFAVGTFGLGFTLGGLVFGRWRKA
jgi:hypothetical protein